jgi:hypothetical protein
VHHFLRFLNSSQNSCLAACPTAMVLNFQDDVGGILKRTSG